MSLKQFLKMLCLALLFFVFVTQQACSSSSSADEDTVGDDDDAVGDDDDAIGDDDDDDDDVVITYDVGGSVSGLDGTLVLQNNGDDDLTLTDDGDFAFDTALVDGEDYAVTVLTDSAGQTCEVTSGSGTVDGADVTDVTITCTDNFYTIGGTVTGLQGPLVLQNNLGDDLAISEDGSFVFSTSLTSGEAYDVTVLSDPNLQTCVVSSGSDNVGVIDVDDIDITCTDDNTWSAVTAVSPAGTDVSQSGGDFVFAASRSGNVLLAWLQGAGDALMVADYDADLETWTVPVDLDDALNVNIATSTSDSLAIDVNDSGAKLISWIQDSDTSGATDNELFYASSVESGIWGIPVDETDTLSTTTNLLFLPSVSVSNAGMGSIAWKQVDTGVTTIEEVTWDSSIPEIINTTTLSAPTTESMDVPHLFYNNSNEAFAFWDAFDSAEDTVHYFLNRANFDGVTWVVPADVTENVGLDEGNFYNVEVAMAFSDNDNGILVWKQCRDDFDELDLDYDTYGEQYNACDLVHHWSYYRATYDELTDTWTNPALLADIMSFAIDAEPLNITIDVNQDGDAFLGWTQHDGANNNLYVSSYDVESETWSEPTDETDFFPVIDVADDVDDFGLAVDGFGNQAVVYEQNGQIYLSSYNVETGDWTHPADVADSLNGDSGTASDPHVAMDEEGNIVAAWLDVDGADVRVFYQEYR